MAGTILGSTDLGAITPLGGTVLTLGAGTVGTLAGTILGTTRGGVLPGAGEAGTAAGMVLIGAAGITHTTTMLTHRTIIITDALHQEDTLLAEATTKAI